MAAALTVVEPTANGIGGDAFALVWGEGKLHGLDGSGRSPRALTRDALCAAGHDRMPARGWGAVTVPGAPLLWHDLHRRFGRLPFAGVLAPAVRLAREGHPVAPLVAKFWKRGTEMLGERKEREMAGWRTTFAPRGAAPRAGELVCLPDHAATLERIGASNAEDFYRGDLARAIDAFSRETGGWLGAEDLASHRSTWVDPISASYRGVELWELPPSGQGVVALAALRILDGLPPGVSAEDPEGVHRSVEAVKLAFADAGEHVADPDAMRLGVDALLEEAYLARRRAAIGPRAEARATGLPPDAGTVFLVAADRDGMMVSLIQSNYMGFGSGVVVPGTGIALQNRGACFRWDPDHPNAVGPRKKPFHTIIPGFLTRNGEPWGPVGVMGGHMQPQGHVQVVRNLVDFAATPQAALDLPRWYWAEGNDVSFERGWPRAVTDALRVRGHELTRVSDVARFGRGQIILRGKDGVLAAGTDPRTEGQALVLEALSP
jgi:gamma-glutamyltranspeptidase/glutathione hydrolase